MTDSVDALTAAGASIRPDDLSGDRLVSDGLAALDSRRTRGAGRP